MEELNLWELNLVLMALENPLEYSQHIKGNSASVDAAIEKVRRMIRCS